MGIIVLVFLPVLTLQGIEGKMFQPMAWTFIFALLGALLVAVFLVADPLLPVSAEALAAGTKAGPRAGSSVSMLRP